MVVVRRSRRLPECSGGPRCYATVFARCVLSLLALRYRESIVTVLDGRFIGSLAIAS